MEGLLAIDYGPGGGGVEAVSPAAMPGFMREGLAVGDLFRPVDRVFQIAVRNSSAWTVTGMARNIPRGRVDR
jgi:hypothetical protein